MSSHPIIERSDIATAIRQFQTQFRWKPNSAYRHLTKRIRRKHLPENATLEDYEAIIKRVVTHENASVHIFWYSSVPYVGIVHSIEHKSWLVLFNLEAVIESAYIVERPEKYLDKDNIVFIDFLKAIMS